MKTALGVEILFAGWIVIVVAFALLAFMGCDDTDNFYELPPELDLDDEDEDGDDEMHDSTNDMGPKDSDADSVYGAR